MKILITGVEGFIGTNLAKKLLEQGHIVYGMDSYITGMKRQVNHGHPNFHFILFQVFLIYERETNLKPNSPFLIRLNL